MHTEARGDQQEPQTQQQAPGEAFTAHLQHSILPGAAPLLLLFLFSFLSHSSQNAAVNFTRFDFLVVAVPPKVQSSA